MDFRIADTFTDSLARLMGDEQKAVKTTAFDLQLKPANPGLQFHRLAKAKDRDFWSVWVNDDIRLILHRTDASLLLCYVDHHDKAYEWAERRKLEKHPVTGAAQLVEIRETVKEIVVPVYVQPDLPLAGKKDAQGKPIFAGASDAELLSYGVPPEWLGDVRNVTSEDMLLALTDHLPQEASEALLELATGGKPRISTRPEVPVPSPFDHPDAQRRFRVMKNVEELERALDFPWEKWTIFLHPEQRQIVEHDYNGPARVAGSAGTGKTIVALHRAAYLARKNPEARVLLTTFSDTLAHALQAKLKRLLGNEPRVAERLEVASLDAIGLRLYTAQIGKPSIANGQVIQELLKGAGSAVGGHKFSLRFLISEWDQVVDAWQLETWDGYRDVARLGRKTRLSEAQRKVLWSIFERVLSELRNRKLITWAGMFTVLAVAIAKNKSAVFDYAVLDEAQDISIAQLKFLAALGANRTNALFFSGDLGQRIFQQPFSWKALGVDIRGRSRMLRVNYSTSHQIRTQADRLLGPEVTDVDGNREDRSDTVSVFNGPPPAILSLKTEEEEINTVSEWIVARKKEGILPHEFGVFVRSAAQRNRARAAVEKAGLPFKILDEHVETTSGSASICTMHLAKGLEFRAVVVMACDDEVIPLQERIQTIATTPTCKKSMTPKGICYTSRARALAIICWSRAAMSRPNF
jgi:AAA domain